MPFSTNIDVTFGSIDLCSNIDKFFKLAKNALCFSLSVIDVAIHFDRIARNLGDGYFDITA